MMHRDSTGVVQRIEPGAVNWMSAGRGIVHSERRPKDLQAGTYRNHGLQLWVALPEAEEESAPSFQHAPAASIPQVQVEGATVHVVVGSAFGAASPIETSSPTLALVFDFEVASGTTVELPALASERALYAVDHPFEIDGEKIDEFTMVVVPAGATPKLAAPRGGRVAADRRRAARASLHFLELRLQPARADPRGRGRLGGAALRAHPRRDRVHSAAGAPPLSRRPAESVGLSISTLPRTASTRPHSVSRSGRKPSSEQRGEEREQRRHHADGAGRARADPILQRQEAGEGQHRAGERQPGQRQPPARRRGPSEVAAEDEADDRRRRGGVEHAEAHRRQERQAAGAVAARRQAADRREQHRGDGEHEAERAALAAARSRDLRPEDRGRNRATEWQSLVARSASCSPSPRCCSRRSAAVGGEPQPRPRPAALAAMSFGMLYAAATAAIVHLVLGRDFAWPTAPSWWLSRPGWRSPADGLRLLPDAAGSGSAGPGTVGVMTPLLEGFQFDLRRCAAWSWPSSATC